MGSWQVIRHSVGRYMVSTGVMSFILKSSGFKVGDSTLESSGSNIVGNSIF